MKRPWRGGRKRRRGRAGTTALAGAAAGAALVATLVLAGESGPSEPAAGGPGPPSTAASRESRPLILAPAPDAQAHCDVTAYQADGVPAEWHEFYFTRAAYTSYGRGWGGRGGAWATDYPKADRQFLTVLRRLTNLDAFECENAVLLDDPRLRRYPFLYALEVGYMNLSPSEVEGLREYLAAGGTLIIDDFWGSQEWLQFEHQMSLVFPGRPIVDLEMDHPLFSTFYEIDEILQVPAFRRAYYGGYSERDGYVPYVKGIRDDEGRLMVIVNWNTDLGDAWEWAEQPTYPLDRSTFAYQMGVNMIVYAMSH